MGREAEAGEPEAEAGARALRRAVAVVWLLTAVLVLHPTYRMVGADYLSRLGLSEVWMFLACAFELALGVRVWRGPSNAAVSLVQVSMIAAFTLILAFLEPLLLASPFGVLTKNLPIVAAIGVAYLLEREGWSPRATWWLRLGMAIIWISEGLLPKIFFQQEVELAIVAELGFIPFDPARFLLLLGAAQALSGALALLMPMGPWLRALLLLQALSLVALPLLVGAVSPELFVHPFGPLTKTIPIVVGTALLARRCSTSR